MWCRRTLAFALAVWSLPDLCLGGHGGGGGGHHHGGAPHAMGGIWHPGMGPVAPVIPVPIGGGWGWGGGFGWGGGSTGVNGPNFFFSQFSIAPPMVIDQGAVGGPMPINPAASRVRVPVRKVKRVDPNKVGQLVTVGDRLFRAGNFKRASERYEQAVSGNPDIASPRLRLAQIALVRGQFDEAAEQIRSAIAAEPNYLANAPDIQTLYAEPADFAKQIAKLESRVLVDPADRDAWLVLGAELYLSGQTRRASDIFVRLTDRKPDQALAAFLDVSNPVEDAAPR